MAVLTKSIGTVTLAGAAEKVELPAFYEWVWLYNMSDSDVLAGTSADISDGADGVFKIPSGECRRLPGDDSCAVYLSGTGEVQVAAQNFVDCPFKRAGKGGGSGAQSGIYPIDPQTGLPFGDVVISEGIIELNSTFKNNTAITSARLPNSLKAIGSYAFNSCTALKKVDFNRVEKIGEYALSYSGITSAVLPETVTEIGNQAFANCQSLTEAYIPAGCTAVAWNAFAQDKLLLDLRVGVGFCADLTITYVGNNQLTAETINAIIANYADNSGKKLTMGAAYLAKLIDEDKAAAAAKGLILA